MRHLGDKQQGFAHGLHVSVPSMLAFSICQKLLDLDDDVVCRPATLATQENVVGRKGNSACTREKCFGKNVISSGWILKIEVSVFNDRKAPVELEVDAPLLFHPAMLACIW